VKVLEGSVNVGVIGAGYWGKKVISEYLALAKENHEVGLLSVCDAQEQNLLYCNRVLGIPKEQLSGNYKEILERDRINAIHICTPNETHYPICKEALMAGKHVLLEKPMTLDPQQAFELMKLAEREDLILNVGYIFRFNNALREARKMINAEFFGHLYYLRLQWTDYVQPTPERDIIFDLGPHPVDVLNFLLGLWPSRIVCKAEAYTRETHPEMAHATAQFNEKTLANVELSWLHPKKERSVSIIGSERSAIVDCLDQSVEIFENHERNGFKIDVQKNNTILDELTHFIKHIHGTSQSVNGGPVGPMNVLVLENMKKSITEDRTVTIDYHTTDA